VKRTPSPAYAALALIAWLLGSAFAPPQLLRDDGSSVPLSPAYLRALQSYKSPLVTARGAVLLDTASGAVLYAKNPDERMAPASLTKMMTALVAVEQAPLAQQITASANVYTEPVVIGLDPGETMRLEDLLYGLLLTSGNDAAIAIAEGVGGTLPRFVSLMNAKAESLGLTNTRFLNPHGLDAPGHYSTALDLARLTAAMMREPVLARVVGAREYTVVGPPLYMFRTSNPLLGRYDGVDGGKTGFTDRAGRCLTVSATRAGHQVVAVMLDSDNIALDGQRLLDYAYGNYEWLPVTPAAALSAEYRVGAERREARLAESSLVPLSHEEPRDIRGRVVLDGDPSAPAGRVGHLILESPLRPLGQFSLSSQEPAR